jgi:hypothetical protein
VIDVIGDEVGVDGGTDGEARRGRADDPQHRVGDVAGGPHTADPGGAGPVGWERQIVVQPGGCLEAERREHLAAGHEARTNDKCPARDDPAVLESHARERTVVDSEPDDQAVDDGDASDNQIIDLFVTEGRSRVSDHRDVRRQLPEQQSLERGGRAGRKHGDRLVAELPALAVQAVHDVTTPALLDPRDRWQLVGQARRDQQPARREGPAVPQLDREVAARPSGSDRLTLHDPSAIAAHLPRPASSSARGPIPSRDKNPRTPAAGAFRGSPLSMTSTDRRTLASVNAALNPAPPPPTITTS